MFNDLSKNKAQLEKPNSEINLNLPFIYGLVGFCSYELGEQLQLKNKKDFNSKTPQLLKFPTLFIGYFTWSYTFDHLKQQGYLTFSPLCSDEIRNKVLDLINACKELKTKSMQTDSSLNLLKWKKSQSFEIYRKQFERIQNYLKNGDCYQVNLTQMFETKTDLDAVDLYFDTRKKTQTPYSCFISFNKHQHLLSFSPEQFISIKNRVIESKPIKGTIPNNGTTENIAILKSSQKNQAENVMIVDLIRNDLGKVCLSKSIHVPELFKVETFMNVHHLVSHIKGTLKADISELEAFLSCFPGGSITGAPKVRAMEIINELELNSRSAYCGSVFYLNQNRDFNSNILIRTAIKDKEDIYCWAGGGIVTDSEVLDEYQESLTKVANITGITK